MKIIQFILFCFLWLISGSSDAGLFDDKGIGAWQNLSFGQARLISCASGVKERTMVVAGVQIQLNKGWVLDKPQISILPDNIPVWLDYPVHAAPINTTKYNHDIVIPISFSGFEPGPFTMRATAPLHACLGSNCQDEVMDLTLTLTDQEGDYTGLCAYLIDQYQQSPIPGVWQGIHGTAYLADEHHLWLDFYQFKKVDSLFLQNSTGEVFQILDQTFLPDRVRLHVYTEKLNQAGTILSWILFTNKGIFRVPVKIMDKPLPMMTTPVSVGCLVWVMLCLFLCSPFFVMWGLKIPKTIQQFVHDNRMAFYWGMAGVLGTLILGYCHIIVPLWLMIWGVILFVGISYQWPKMGWLAALFLILPKPYLNDILKLESDRMGVYCILMFGTCFVYWVAFKLRNQWADRLYSWLKESMKLNSAAQRGFFYVPMLVVIVLWFWGMYQPKVQYQTPDFSQDGVYVACTKSDCSLWQKQNEVSDVTLIQPDKNLIPFGMNVTDFNRGFIVWIHRDEKTWWPIQVSPKQVSLFQSIWKSYHASDKLIDPPTHFGDDPRVPLPNAK